MIADAAVARIDQKVAKSTRNVVHVCAQLTLLIRQLSLNAW